MSEYMNRILDEVFLNICITKLHPLGNNVLPVSFKPILTQSRLDYANCLMHSGVDGRVVLVQY